MNRFPKRTYRSPLGLISDSLRILSSPTRLSSLLRAERISHAFRERLMLVVTGVNACRYCSFAHSNLAMRTGIEEAEIRALLGGDVQAAPADEIPALRYAIAWAQADGRPDSDLRDQLIEQYGAEVAREVELALRMIRIGNLTGNTFDALLYYLSGGRAGAAQKKLSSQEKH